MAQCLISHISMAAILKMAPTQQAQNGISTWNPRLWRGFYVEIPWETGSPSDIFNDLHVWCLGGLRSKTLVSQTVLGGGGGFTGTLSGPQPNLPIIHYGEFYRLENFSLSPQRQRGKSSCLANMPWISSNARTTWWMKVQYHVMQSTGGAEVMFCLYIQSSTCRLQNQWYNVGSYV